MSACTDAEFIALWRNCSYSPSAVAKSLGCNVRAVYSRRARLAARGIVLETVADPHNRSRIWSRTSPVNPARSELDIGDGVVIVFSDAHYWPGEASVGHKALVSLITQLRPKVIIANGDVLDGATISRHDRDGWAARPTLAAELEACKERLGEVEDAAGVDCALLWNQGNHDQRYDRKLAMDAAAFEGLPGTTLPEHFPRWTYGVSTMINPSGHHPVMVKHRIYNGVHATYNGTLKSGISTVTGHLHQLRVFAWGDYRGRRYGVDTGTLADPHGPQFKYAEDNPVSGAQGFAVLSFRNGTLLPPELCEVVDNEAIFRGSLVIR